MDIRKTVWTRRRLMLPLLTGSCALLAAATMSHSGLRAEDDNRTGQSQQTPGAGVSIPTDPAADAKPTLPGDRPAKEGMDPSSQVHNVNPRDLKGETHRD